MTPTPSSSSPSGASATSSTPTRSSRRLVLQFVLPTLAALGAALVTAIPYVAVTVERHQIETLGERLLAEARLAGAALPWTSGAPLDAACTQLAADLGVRLTVIATDGRVLGESTRSSESLENHADRRSEEHTSELQSLAYLVCRLLLEKKKTTKTARSIMNRRASA